MLDLTSPLAARRLAERERERDVERLYRRAINEARWSRASGAIVASLPLLFAVALFVTTLWLLGDCGNVANAQGHERAAALAHGMHRWQPSHGHDPLWVADLARINVYECESRRDPFGGPLCPEVLASLQWRESRWRPNAEHMDTGALGLGQLMRIAWGGLPRDRVREPWTNVRLTALWLDRALRECRGRTEHALSRYVGHGCRPSGAARGVLRNAAEVERLSAKVLIVVAP